MIPKEFKHNFADIPVQTNNSTGGGGIVNISYDELMFMVGTGRIIVKTEMNRQALLQFIVEKNTKRVEDAS